MPTAQPATSSTPNSPTSDREIVISRLFNAPREMVWNAFTDPQQVVQWWGPNGFTTTIEKMELHPGGAWTLTMHGPDGTEYPNKSIFVEVVKPERIVYKHGGGKVGARGANFEATWTFEEEDGLTRLTGRMVFATSEDRDYVVETYGAIEGGKQTLARLAEHLPTLGAPRPFIITRTFDAPRELVWKAWTERDRLMEWFGPKGFTMTIGELDFRPGGTFHYCLTSADGKAMWGKWVFREITPPEWLVLVSCFSDEQGGKTRPPMAPGWPLETLSTTTFAEQDGKTTITIQWSPLNATDAERQLVDSAHAGMNQGWSGTFEQLEAYLAKEA